MNRQAGNIRKMAILRTVVLRFMLRILAPLGAKVKPEISRKSLLRLSGVSAQKAKSPPGDEDARKLEGTMEADLQRGCGRGARLEGRPDPLRSNRWAVR